MRQATGLSQELVDRAAALSARPTATQDLVDAMAKLSNSYHEVEAMLNEIEELLKVCIINIVFCHLYCEYRYSKGISIYLIVSYLVVFFLIGSNSEMRSC